MANMLISVVVPCYNEERNIPAVYEAIKKALAAIQPKYDAEIIFVDDGSKDGSVAEMEKLVQKDTEVKFVAFSRNFGKEAALSAGIRYAKGDVVIMLDADFQHPPELIPLFLEKWQNGAEVVVGVRENDANDSIVRRWGAKLFYAAMRRIGETKLVPRGTDFRLISRPVADAFNQFTEHGRIGVWC